MMEEIKKYWFYIFIFCLIFVGTGGAAWVGFASGNIANGQVMESHESISSIVHTERSQREGKDICIVSEGVVEKNSYIKINPLNLTDRYLLLRDYKYSEYSVDVGGHYDIYNIEYYKAQIYDVDTLEFVNELDVKVIADDLLNKNPDYFIAAIYPDKTQNIVIALDKIPNLSENLKRFHYNVMTSEGGSADSQQQFTDFASDEQKRMQEEYREEFGKLSDYIALGKRGVNRIYKLRTFQCNEIYNEPGVAYVTIACEELPVKSQELYSRFPGLEVYQGQSGKLVNVFFYGYQNPVDILHMFLEEGTKRWYEE